MAQRMKIVLSIIAAIVIAAASFSGGLLYGTTTAKKQSPELAAITQAWDAIQKQYVEPSALNSENLSHGAIQGLLTSLNDAHSAFLDKQTFTIFQSDIQGQFQGIGAEIGLSTNGTPMIVTPLPDSPAEKAGLQFGDLILAVDGTPTAGQNLQEIVLLIRGPGGTSVTLTILRPGDPSPVDIKMIRSTIKPSTVTFQMRGDIAYIRLLDFADTTNTEINKVLQTANFSSAKGIVLDVRGNPGGLVSAFINVASHFIKNGTLVTMVDNKGNKQVESVHSNGAFTDLPMVILTDNQTASAAEMFTGALKDYHRATIAGAKTFGKGSYNITIPLQDGSAIYLTIGRWLRPNGQLIEGLGIDPDYPLTITGDAEIQWAIDFLHSNK